MSKYKRVWAMLGVVGLLGALMALSAVTPTPAGADVGPDNEITITKIVNGTPDSGGATFGLAVECADPDPTAVEDPPSQGGDTTVNFEEVQDVGLNGGTVTISVPAWYVRCAFGEVNTQGADSTLVQATTSTAPLTTITIGAGTNATSSLNYADFADGGGQAVQAFVVNVFNARTSGTVRITKAVAGAVPAGAFWQIRTTCAEDAIVGNPNRVIPARVVDAVFLAPGTQDILIPTTDGDGIAKDCTPIVDENVIQPPGAVDTYDPAAANTTGLNTILGGQTTTRLVTVTNTYPGPTNQITVTKTVVGSAPAGTQHTIDVRCINTGTGQTYVASLYAMNAGETHVFNTPASTPLCSVQETNHAWDTAEKIPDSIGVTTFPVISGAVVQSYAGAGCPTLPGPLTFFNLGAVGRTCSLFSFANTNGGHTSTVGITNRYIAGPFHTITVNKATSGAVPANAVFVVQISCDEPIAPGGPSVYYMAFGPGLPETQSVNWQAFTSGGNNDCSVTEINSAGAVSQTYASGPSSPGTLLHVFQNPGGRVWIDWDQEVTGESAQVNIVNRFNPKTLPDNTLRIKKQLRGRIPAGASFTIQVRCAGGGITDTTNLTFGTNSFQEILVPANRSDCRVVETANGGAQSVSYFASSATADATDGPSSARVNFGTVEGAQRGKVIVRNQFPGTCPRPGPKFC